MQQRKKYFRFVLEQRHIPSVVPDSGLISIFKMLMRKQILVSRYTKQVDLCNRSKIRARDVEVSFKAGYSLFVCYIEFGERALAL